jgi:hypothetical protein
MPSRPQYVATGVATLQMLDVVANAIPLLSMSVRLDNLGVPEGLRPALPAIKVATSAGLLVGLRWPRVGATASAVLVSFYSAAVGFHWFAGDHPLAALPAAALGTSAAASLIGAKRGQSTFRHGLEPSSRSGGFAISVG